MERKENSKLSRLLNLCLEKNIPFVSFRFPDKDRIFTWIQRSGKFDIVESVSEIFHKTGFVYAPFHRRTNFPVVFFEPELILTDDEIEDDLLKEIAAIKPLYPEYPYNEPPVISKLNYLQQAEKFIHSFDDNFRKAVLSRVHTDQIPSGFNVGDFFIRMQKEYPSAFCHLIHIPGNGTWCGASPEVLLKMDEKNIYTVALAGTQRYSDLKQTVVWQDKEIEEQQLVTDYIKNVLLQVNISDYLIEKPQTLRAGEVLHLSTKFSFNKKLLENRLDTFIQRLHPTPAVCGVPKEQALDLIFSTEKHNREYYSGFSGTINFEGRTDLFVNLRCMKILKDKACFVCGWWING